MKKITGKILFALAFASVLGMAGASHAGAPIYKNNALGASHVTPPGTHVAMVPPRGAVLSSTFAGFETEDGAARIMVTERAGMSYKEVEGTLTKEGVESLSIAFADKSPVTLNGSPATLVSGTSLTDDSTGALLLVLGNDKMVVYIYGFYRAGNKAEEAAFKNSMLSCVFNPSTVKSVGGGYSVSPAGTSFKFSDEVGSTRYYTVGGGKFDEAGGALYTSTVTDDYIPADARKAYVEAAMNKFLSSYENHSVTSTRQVLLGKLNGIETIAEFDGAVRRSRTSSGANVRRQMKGKGYQVLLFDENEGKVFIFSGIALRDVDSYISQFIKITSTFAIEQ